MRLAREAVTQDEAEGQNGDLEAILESSAEEDKIYGAMAVAKTIGTVSLIINYHCCTQLESEPYRSFRPLNPRQRSLRKYRKLLSRL